jgi:hypothetical protein
MLVTVDKALAWPSWVCGNCTKLHFEERRSLAPMRRGEKTTMFERQRFEKYLEGSTQGYWVPRARDAEKRLGRLVHTTLLSVKVEMGGLIKSIRGVPGPGGRLRSLASLAHLPSGKRYRRERRGAGRR